MLSRTSCKKVCAIHEMSAGRPALIASGRLISAMSANNERKQISARHRADAARDQDGKLRVAALNTVDGPSELAAFGHDDARDIAADLR